MATDGTGEKPQIEIRPLQPELLEDFLELFDRRAFCDNPDWASCYCQFYLADHTRKDWEERGGEENRAAAIRRIQTGAMHGYLAYVDGRPAGWVHAAPLSGLPNLAAEPELVREHPERTGAVACFVVAPGERRKGVARALLRAAMQGFGYAGLDRVEGYPRPGRSDAAGNYHGPLKLYLDEGFNIVHEYPEFIVVEKDLHR